MMIPLRVPFGGILQPQQPSAIFEEYSKKKVQQLVTTQLQALGTLADFKGTGSKANICRREDKGIE